MLLQQMNLKRPLSDIRVRLISRKCCILIGLTGLHFIPSQNLVCILYWDCSLHFIPCLHTVYILHYVTYLEGCSVFCSTKSVQLILCIKKVKWKAQWKNGIRGNFAEFGCLLMTCFPIHSFSPCKKFFIKTLSLSIMVMILKHVKNENLDVIIIRECSKQCCAFVFSKTYHFDEFSVYPCYVHV